MGLEGARPRASFSGSSGTPAPRPAHFAPLALPSSLRGMTNLRVVTALAAFLAIGDLWQSRAVAPASNAISAELLILSLLEAQPRHGYDLSKLVRSRSGGKLTFHIDSLYPLLYRLEERVDQGRVGRETGRTAAASLSADGGRPASPRPSAQDVGGICRGGAPRHRRRTCCRRRKG
jgi:Transcriptional regulator PadR-like family